MENVAYLASPLGTLRLVENGEAITGLHFAKDTAADPKGPQTPLLKKAAEQLEEFFSGKRKVFDLPLAPKGTEFQMRCWAALQTIPYGVTWSYKQLAEAVHSPKGFRAVGMANNRNPISIFIPCHRVIGADGSLTGYGGGMDAKTWLLNLER